MSTRSLWFSCDSTRHGTTVIIHTNAKATAKFTVTETDWIIFLFQARSQCSVVVLRFVLNWFEGVKERGNRKKSQKCWKESEMEMDVIETDASLIAYVETIDMNMYENENLVAIIAIKNKE